MSDRLLISRIFIFVVFVLVRDTTRMATVSIPRSTMLRATLFPEKDLALPILILVRTLLEL